jgi:hypothetical protein
VSHLVRVCNSPGLKTSQEGADVSHARAKRWVVALLLVFFFSSAAHAQLYTGSVTGVVTDPSGAVVPSAKVTLTDQNKGYSYTAATDPATGRYVLRSIPPGTYKITVEAQNFQREVQTGIALDVSQNITADFSLRVGAATEVVEVKGGVVQLQTEDAVTGQVVNRKFVNDLPLIDRNFTDLTFLAPGVVETNVPGTKASQGGINFNSNGSRNATADTLIDGATASNFDQNSGINNVLYNPSVDSVEEFKVQQSNFTAEYGFAAGTIINVVTRSGSNQFHGSAYEFWRNQILDANDWFNNKTNTPIGAFRRNNFGGTVGGPIKKDKTFFFFDYEGLRERASSGNSGFFGVPTLCERGDPSATCPVGASALGNFGELCTLQGGAFDTTGKCSVSSGQLWDPYTGKFDTTQMASVRQMIPFNNLATYISPGNPAKGAVLPAGAGNLIDPLAAKLFLLFPKPNQPVATLADAQNNNFFASGVNPTSNNQFDIKIDHRFSDRDLLSAKYFQQSRTSNSLNCYGNFTDPCSSGPDDLHVHVFSINHTHTFSPNLVLTITLGLNRSFEFSHGIASNFSNFNPSSLGIPSYLEKSGFPAIPAITINQYATTAGNSTNIGGVPFAILREGQDSYHLAGVISWVRGKHELKFGGEGRMHRINFVQPGWPSGQFTFDFSSTSQIFPVPDFTFGGDSLASFLTGVGPSADSSGSGCTPCFRGFTNFVSTQSFGIAEFVQDNFRVTPKLTLNLGLRYELPIPRTERYNRMNWLDPNLVSPFQPAQSFPLVQPIPGVTVPQTLVGGEVFASPSDRYNYYTDYRNIQPRFGLAYQLAHGFVVRGGYGIYFSTPRSSASGTGPWGFQGFDIQPPWITVINDGTSDVTPCCRLNNPAPNGVADPPGNAKGALNDIGFAAVGPVRQESLNIPYEQTWSFGFQKELPAKILFDASYVGKKGTHLYLGGHRETDILGPQVLNLSPSQIQALAVNSDQPNPFFCSTPPCDPHHFIADPNSGLSAPTISRFQLQLPFPQFTGFQTDSPPIANSIYHALQIRAEKQFSNGLQFLLTYVWSKSIDDASASDDSFSFLGGGTVGGGTIDVQNPYNLAAERAVSVYDIPQILQLSYVYEFPVGRGKWLGRNMNPILNVFIGGWQTNGIARIDTGRPILLTLATGNRIPTFGQMRPTLNGVLQGSSGSPERFTNTADPNAPIYFANPGVLSQTPDYTLGNASRTTSSVRQPGQRNVSMSLFKEFPLRFREGTRLEFRAEAFNVFNHPYFQGPNSDFGSANFGKVTSTLGHARELQLALKLYF